jgi:hypothetical protein
MNEAFKERIVDTSRFEMTSFLKRKKTIANTPGGVTARHRLAPGQRLRVAAQLL